MDAEIETQLPSLARRVARHAALADPHRLAVVDALALGDHTPSDLGQALGLPSNLLAHHLDILERAGLVARTQSHGDRRRRYVRLVPEALAELLPAPVLRAASVLFVCHHNSARSQLARALWAAVSPVPADSAGLEPADTVHPGAVTVARRHGLDLSDAQPKGYGALSRPPDLVISVCDLSRETQLPPAPVHVHWSVPDPVAVGDEAAFEAVHSELAQRVAHTVPRILPRD